MRKKFLAWYEQSKKEAGTHIYLLANTLYIFCNRRGKRCYSRGSYMGRRRRGWKGSKGTSFVLANYLKHTYLAANGSSIYEIHKKRRGGHSNLL